LGIARGAALQLQQESLGETTATMSGGLTERERHAEAMELVGIDAQADALYKSSGAALVARWNQRTTTRRYKVHLRCGAA
jgi:hypothetical protein